MQKNIVPAWWANAPLSDVTLKLVDGSHNPPKKQEFGMPMLSAINISNNQIHFSSYRFISEADFLNEHKRTQIQSGDVLLTIVGAIGRAAVVPVGEMPFTLQRSVAVLTPALINSKFLMYQLESPRIETFFKKNARGTAQKGVYLKTLGTTDIWFPSLSEQGRIVAKIEELYSELDNGIESLKAAKRKLRSYRQAVLKHAFQGKLTAQWREENRDKLESSDQLLARIREEREIRYQQQLSDWKQVVKVWESKGRKGKKPGKPRAPKPVTRLNDDIRKDLPAIPDSWAWSKLGWMTCGVEYGTSAKSSKSGAVPVIRMGNIQKAMIDWDDLVFTSDKDEIEKYTLSAGDVLFNRTNSPELVGKTAIYRGERPAVYAGYLIRVNQIPSIVDSQYLNLFLNSHIARQYGNTVKTDGVNQSNINGEKLQSYPFPYSSLAEQQEVVRILEEKLSLADRMISDIDTELLVADALHQSILKRAYSGQLVEQDPKDEPATVLLERIKAEKEVQTKGKKNNNRKDAA